jgi:hypothetical protein
MGVAIRSSWQLNEPVLGDTFSFVHAFAFAPPLPEFLAGVGAFGCFRWSFAYSAFASSRNWPVWLFRGYATQVLECGRWVSIHCRDCEVLKCEAAESTGFDTETAIKSTGLGLTHATAAAVSPWRAFNQLETEGWHHDPRSRSLRFKQPFCMGGRVGIAVSPTCSQGPLPAINGRMLGTDSLEDLAVHPALNGARIPAQNIYVV